MMNGTDSASWANYTSEPTAGLHNVSAAQLQADMYLEQAAAESAHAASVPWYRGIEIALVVLSGAAFLLLYLGYRDEINKEIEEIRTGIHDNGVINYGVIKAKDQLHHAQDVVEKKTHVEVSAKRLVHAWHVLPWYWLVFWIGGCTFWASVGFTFLIFIPGFFLLSVVMWTALVLGLNAERLDVKKELERQGHSMQGLYPEVSPRASYGVDPLADGLTDKKASVKKGVTMENPMYSGSEEDSEEEDDAIEAERRGREGSQGMLNPMHDVSDEDSGEDETRGPEDRSRSGGGESDGDNAYTDGASPPLSPPNPPAVG